MHNATVFKTTNWEEVNETLLPKVNLVFNNNKGMSIYGS